VKSPRFARYLTLGVAAGVAAINAGACADTVKVDVGDTSNDFLDLQVDPAAGVPRISDACITEASAAEQRRVAMYVMLDSSGSMDEPTGTGATKWQAVQRAIRAFMLETRETDLSMGLQFFPLIKPGSKHVCESHEDCGPGGPCFLTTCLQGTTITLCESQADCPGSPTTNPCVEFGLCENSDPVRPTACLFGGNCQDGLGACQDFERTCTNATQCDASFYATPAVEIGPISEQLNAIDRALSGQPPQGLTPTVPALQGAVQHAREWALTHPDQAVVTVLATDGLPSECGPEVEGAPPPIQRVLDIAREAQVGELPIRTFVIGVFQAGDTGSVNNVNAIAQAGGTEQGVFIDTDGEVETQFLEALRTIRSGTLACQFQIPASESELDYFRVNLEFDDGTTKRQLSYVNDEAGCAASPNSWHYDVNATVTKPSAIQVCPAVCDQFKAATQGSISLQLGCATILR
jgi:Mg-chelatase subunit ChlD